MVTSIARQSVILKCNMQKSVLTGNYEYYYAAGLIAKLWGIEIPEEIAPGELKELLGEKSGMLTPAAKQEKYLCHLAGEYRPGEEYDVQMKELLLLGKTEERLWQM